MMHDMTIAPVLKKYFSDLSEVQSSPWKSTHSLSQANFWQVQLGSNRWLCKALPNEPANLKAMRLGHHLQKHLAFNECQLLPKPHPADDGTTIQQIDDLLWELLAWVPGESCDPTTASPELKIEMFQALASVHRDSKDYGGGCIQGWSQILRKRAQGLAELSKTLRTTGIASDLSAVESDFHWPLLHIKRLFPDVVPIATRAVERVSQVTFELHPILRDSRAEHFIIEQEHVSGIVDWGAACWDTPLVDVARLLGDLASHSTKAWNEALDYYDEKHRLEEADRRACFALHASGTLLAGWRWWQWIVEEQRTFEPAAPVLKRLALITERLEHMAMQRLKF